jgi:O-acetyl-ADP-ribose deacetylase (regulator of RNase III)
MAVTIVIADTRPAVIHALKQTLGTFADHFRPDHVRVVIHHGRVEDWDEEGVCFVNPGNALGEMTGALDRALLGMLPGVDADVRAIVNQWGKSARDGTRHLPLFSAVLSRANNRWLITAPCMFVAGPQEFRDTRNAFHATHAALSMLVSANRAGMGIHRVVMPGVCTGHGRMNRANAARQMAEAFRAVFMDHNIAFDPQQAQHPRLMLLPRYERQPVVPAHAPFLP